MVLELCIKVFVLAVSGSGLDVFWSTDLGLCCLLRPVVGGRFRYLSCSIDFIDCIDYT